VFDVHVIALLRYDSYLKGGGPCEPKGITFDTGFVRHGVTSRAVFDPAVAARELRIIRDDLHCTAVRVTGGDPQRLETTAALAVDLGLEVWFSPYPLELTTDEMLALFADCAERAERLRLRGGEIVFVTGAELCIMDHGFLPGDSLDERLELLTSPDRARERIGEVGARINDFLGRAAAVVRERFGGRLTYASVPLERVDWAPFDIVSVDLYRNAEVADRFAEGVRTLVAQGKPAAVTEFGSSTFRGAAARAGDRLLRRGDGQAGPAERRVRPRRGGAGRLPARAAGDLRLGGPRQRLRLPVRAARSPAPPRRRPAPGPRPRELRHRQGLRGPARRHLSRHGLGAEGRLPRAGSALRRDQYSSCQFHHAYGGVCG
jgi:hypothetical protein